MTIRGAEYGFPRRRPLGLSVNRGRVSSSDRDAQLIEPSGPVEVSTLEPYLGVSDVEEAALMQRERHAVSSHPGVLA